MCDMIFMDKFTNNNQRKVYIMKEKLKLIKRLVLFFIGMVIIQIGVGPIIDFSLKILNYIQISSYNILIRSLMLVLVSFIIAIGFSILSATNLGFAPNDSVYFIISDKTKYQHRWVRMVTDICYLIIGLLLGGVVGIGTIISALLTGPFVQLCLPYGKKFVDMIIENKNINKFAEINNDLDI